MSSESKKTNNKPKSISNKEEAFYVWFGETLQMIKNDKNKLQSDFYETTGMSNKTISKVENALSKLNAFEYELIQYDLGFNFRDYVDDLFESNSNLSNKTELIRFVKDLSEEESAILLKIAYIIFTNAKGETKWKRLLNYVYV